MLKGAKAIEYSGEKTKGGAVEITPKTNTHIDMGTLSIVTSSATKKRPAGNYQTFKGLRN